MVREGNGEGKWGGGGEVGVGGGEVARGSGEGGEGGRGRLGEPPLPPGLTAYLNTEVLLPLSEAHSVPYH